MTSSRKSLIVFVAIGIGLLSRTALASSAGMPWEGPLARLVQSLTGPVAKGIGVAAIVLAAVGMALSEGGSTHKTFLRILFALAICFSASTFGLQFLGFSGGLAL
jgi:type IV secretory pathway VirB2 component (pilin)